MSSTDTERADHLRVLGLNDDEIRVYQHLLRTGPSSITELGEAVPDQARSGSTPPWADWSRPGLARRSGSDHSRFLPVPPDAGLEALTLRRESELKQARIEVLNAYDEFRRTVHNESTTHLIEVVTGSAIVERIHQIKGSVAARDPGHRLPAVLPRRGPEPGGDRAAQPRRLLPGRLLAGVRRGAGLPDREHPALCGGR